jgi:hypothetical protein
MAFSPDPDPDPDPASALPIRKFACGDVVKFPSFSLLVSWSEC